MSGRWLWVWAALFFVSVAMAIIPLWLPLVEALAGHNSQ